MLPHGEGKDLTSSISGDCRVLLNQKRVQVVRGTNEAQLAKITSKYRRALERRQSLQPVTKERDADHILE